MKVTLLSIKRGTEENTYDAMVQLGSEERVFRFTITPLHYQIGEVDVFITSSEEFGKMFRYYADAYGTADQLVGRFHQGRPLELPYYLGDYDITL